jgi:lysophospholipase L1-like esterase
VKVRARGPDVHQLTLGRKILFSSIILIAILLLCEGALRVRGWIRYGGGAAAVRDPMLAYDRDADLYVPTPGYEVKGARLHIKINSLGFRGDEFARVKPPHTIRIAVLGASTTFNAEVSSNHATWPHQLQELLRADYPDVTIEVVNAALGGYVAADNLKNLRHRVLPLNPDLVIYYEANNEIVRDTRELALRQGLITTGGRSPLVTTLSRYSLMFDLAYKNAIILARGRGGPAQKIDRVPRELPERFIGLLDQMRIELDRKSTPLMLSTFLVKYRRNQDRATQMTNADVAFYYMPWMSIDGMLDAMDVYNQSILDYAGRQHLAVVDDREAIPPDAEHFTDCMHLADKGAQAMAERFHRYMRAHGTIEALIARLQASPAAGL